MSFSSKRENSNNLKEKDNLQSAGDTFFDSLHNSKISENTKTKFFQQNKKENNFYLALKCMRGPDNDTFLLGTSEFSENNPNQTREENISRYLHHPIIKEINKEGNNLIRIKPKQNYASIVNHPYISKYNNMKNIFTDILKSVKEIEKKENIIHPNNNNIVNINEIEIKHKKNNSSISNNNYKNHSIYNNNILFGIKSNQINSTTVTKGNNNNQNNIDDDVKDIKKQINYDNLEDLEESKDIDINNYIINEETNKNNIDSENPILNDDDFFYGNTIQLNYYKNYNDKNTDLKTIQKNSISTKKDEILVIDSLNEAGNNINNNQNSQNVDINNKKDIRTSIVKKLRKKYERTAFKNYIYNTNPYKNRYIYQSQELNKDIIIKKDRKKTVELNINTKTKNQYMDNNMNINNTVKHNINISAKNFSELEDSLSQLSNNINKNLLDNFNNCGNFKNNEFLMRYRNQNIENNGNNNINNNNQNMNYNYNSHLKKSQSRQSTPADLLDFISNKSDNNSNLNTNNNNNNNINTNANINKINNNNEIQINNNSDNNNNTFVIKNIENKLDIYSDGSNNNVNCDINRSTKSELKENNEQNNNLLFHSQTQTQNQIYEISSSNKYNNENENTNTDNFYDFITPEKNPEATMRRNFTLLTPLYYRNSSKSNDININYKCHSCNYNINKINLEKNFSNISNKNINEEEKQNSIKSKKSTLNSKNSFYLIENKDKIINSHIIPHPQPETIYDLTFYKNLIENNSKIKRINYKNILRNQKKIKWEDRLHTMVWMMEICEEFAFKRDTFHYACNYLDNYLTFGNEKIKNKKTLELIGITCISISGKIEEVQIPKLKEYANSIDESFEIKDIIDMEQNICSTLGWKLINVNINTWLNWYTCQWDLYIDSVDDIKSQLLKYIKEDDIIYYKKSNDNSYYNYRIICQLVDIIILDYYSYTFESRVLMAASLFVVICINYKFDYNFKKQTFRQQNDFSAYIFEVYNQFLSQSFDYNFNDEIIQKALAYCYQFKNFNFTYDIPLLYQIHQELLENGNYEDFVSYQTTNDNIEDYLKDIIVKRNKKNCSEKTTSSTDKNKFTSYKKATK